MENLENFDNLYVKGDVTWETSSKVRGSLGYFLKNAVTKSDDQDISGPVSFEEGVVVAKVIGSQFVNGVDLKFIAEDAIYKSYNSQVLLLILLIIHTNKET